MPAGSPALGFVQQVNGCFKELLDNLVKHLEAEIQYAYSQTQPFPATERDSLILHLNDAEHQVHQFLSSHETLPEDEIHRLEQAVEWVSGNYQEALKRLASIPESERGGSPVGYLERRLAQDYGILSRPLKQMKEKAQAGQPEPLISYLRWAWSALLAQETKRAAEAWHAEIERGNVDAPPPTSKYDPALGQRLFQAPYEELLQIAGSMGVDLNPPTGEVLLRNPGLFQERDPGGIPRAANARYAGRPG